MRYTVNKLAKLSGVSPRTLRFYDEIGLLKPAFYGDNKYRYYEEEQLLMLQQVLFFRELGFPLDEIQRIISSDDFDKIEALNAHKSILQKNLESTTVLIRTIDKTILYLRGNAIMSEQEMYAGFDPKKQQEYENYLLDKKVLTESEIHKFHEKVKHWKKEDWERHKNHGDEITNAFLATLQKGLKPSDPEVQSIVLRHHNWVKPFWTPSKKSYIEFGELYKNHPDFRKFYETYDPALIDYIFDAIQFFAENKLD